MILVFFHVHSNHFTYEKKRMRKNLCVCLYFLTFTYKGYKNVFNFHNKKEIIKVFHCTWAEIILYTYIHNLHYLCSLYILLCLFLKHFPVSHTFLLLYIHTCMKKNTITCLFTQGFIYTHTYVHILYSNRFIFFSPLARFLYTAFHAGWHNHIYSRAHYVNLVKTKKEKLFFSLRTTNFSDTHTHTHTKCMDDDDDD